MHWLGAPYQLEGLPGDLGQQLGEVEVGGDGPPHLAEDLELRHPALVARQRLGEELHHHVHQDEHEAQEQEEEGLAGVVDQHDHHGEGDEEHLLAKGREEHPPGDRPRIVSLEPQPHPQGQVVGHQEGQGEGRDQPQHRGHLPGVGGEGRPVHPEDGPGEDQERPGDRPPEHQEGQRPAQPPVAHPGPVCATDARPRRR